MTIGTKRQERAEGRGWSPIRADEADERGGGITDRPIKVAAVTLLFWVVKILSTGMGETTSDFFVRRFDPVMVVLIGATLFVVVLGLQFMQRCFVASVYWLAVVMVSVFGTMAADVTHVVLGVPYLVSAIGFAVVLAAVFAIWARVEGTLSIHSITSPRRELFYWLAVVTTFALGTATGDLTATTFHLGYLASGILFMVVFVVPVVGWWRFGLDPVLAFWFAYIVTRPFGASFADWMGVTPDRGGLGWGTGPVSLVLAVVIAVLVGFMAVGREGRSSPDAAEPVLD